MLKNARNSFRNTQRIPKTTPQHASRFAAGSLSRSLSPSLVLPLRAHFSSPICSVPKIKCAQRKQTVGYHLKAPNGICLCRARGAAAAAGGGRGGDGAGAMGNVKWHGEGLIRLNMQRASKQTAQQQPTTKATKSVDSPLSWNISGRFLRFAWMQLSFGSRCEVRSGFLAIKNI